jgi:hypothetical protein
MGTIIQTIGGIHWSVANFALCILYIQKLIDKLLNFSKGKRIRCEIDLSFKKYNLVS